MSDNEMLNLILEKVTGLDQKVSGLDQKVTGLEKDNQELKQEIATIKNKVSNIELTLENETNRNIKIIAEGHLDLSRKLDNALKVESEKEMLLIRVNILENELRKLKNHVIA